jgi:hypothetical protein
VAIGPKPLRGPVRSAGVACPGLVSTTLVTWLPRPDAAWAGPRGGAAREPRSRSWHSAHAQSTWRGAVRPTMSDRWSASEDECTKSIPGTLCIGPAWWGAPMVTGQGWWWRGVVHRWHRCGEVTTASGEVREGSDWVLHIDGDVRMMLR